MFVEIHNLFALLIITFLLGFFFACVGFYLEEKDKNNRKKRKLNEKRRSR